MNKKTTFIRSLFITALLFITLFFSKDFLGDSLSRSIIRDLIMTLFYFSALTSTSIFILFFFTQKIFKVWLNKFMIWFFPLSVLVIASGTTEVSFGWSTRTDLAISMGSIMVAVTLVLALIQRFYYGIK